MIAAHSPRSVLALLLLLAASACGSPTLPEDGEPPPDVVPVEGVKLVPQSIQLSGVGDTQQLHATVSPSNATDRAVSWESTNPAIARVDSLGLVTAVSVGLDVFVTVYTHDGAHEASTNVQVTPAAGAAP